MPSQPPRRTPISRATALVASGLALLALASVGVFLLLRADEPPKPLAGAPPARDAAKFTDSVGVNVHLTYYDTAYERFDEWVARLRDLGVRHIRDGLVPADPRYVQRMESLARQGVRASLITSDKEGSAAEAVSPIEGPLRRVTATLEAPNEPDLAGGTAWEGPLRRFLPQLKSEADGRLGRAVPLLGPSFVKPESRKRVDGLTDQWTVDNIHPYPGGEQPVRPGDLAQLTGRKPVMATETGYHNAVDAPGGQPGVPEGVAGAYLPRLLAENFNAGIQRTFLYELIDQKPDPEETDPEQHFGLLRQDLSPKPGYRSIRNLLRFVAASPGAGKGRAAKVESNDAGVQQLLLKRGDGSSVLLLWRRVSLWNTARKQPIDQTPSPVRVAFAGEAEDIRVGYPSRASDTTERPNGSRTSVLVGADLVTLSFR